MENNKTVNRIILIFVAIALAAVSYFAGRSNAMNEAEKEKKLLQSLNRSSIHNMNVNDGVIYVIGHQSPDSDTVCSAIAYARLLTMLGHEAEARITAPVNNETKFILSQAGVEVPPVLEDAAGKNIFLVDHSEYLQAAPGMLDAHIVGVIDHHGIGSVTTGHQVVYEARPIGATATIIWLDYLNYGLEIDKTTAQLLLGALLSDTSNLTGSTVCETDGQALKYLAEIAEVQDVDALYRQQYEQLLSYEGFTDQEILFSDYKEYDVYGVTFGIGIVNAIDEETAAQLAARMKEALAEGFGTKDVDMMYASVGIRDGDVKTDYIVCANAFSEKIFLEAFPNYDEFDGNAYIFRNGGLGRKSKFVPGMTDYLSSLSQSD